MIVNSQEVTHDDAGYVLISLDQALAGNLKNFVTDMLSAQIEGIYRVGGATKDFLEIVHRDMVTLCHLGIALGCKDEVANLAQQYADILSQFAHNAQTEEQRRECFQMRLELSLVFGIGGAA